MHSAQPHPAGRFAHVPGHQPRERSARLRHGRRTAGRHHRFRGAWQPAGRGEPFAHRTTDDRLVAAVRTGEDPPRLRTSFSTDQGRTWSPSEPPTGPDGPQIVGISPQLLLQPNGVLLLETGRPDDRLYVSHDGTGRTWDDQQLVFSRYPSETGNGRFDGTSGNNAMVNVDATCRSGATAGFGTTRATRGTRSGPSRHWLGPAEEVDTEQQQCGADVTEPFHRRQPADGDARPR
jgi:hypothetical protein